MARHKIIVTRILRSTGYLEVEAEGESEAMKQAQDTVINTYTDGGQLDFPKARGSFEFDYDEEIDSTNLKIIQGGSDGK